jgi:hypothetical protein
MAQIINAANRILQLKVLATKLLFALGNLILGHLEGNGMLIIGDIIAPHINGHRNQGHHDPAVELGLVRREKFRL